MIIKRILELDKEATDGPWYAGESAYNRYKHRNKSPINAYNGTVATAFTDRKDQPGIIPDNALLIAEYRTLCPQAAKMLEVAVEALKRIEEFGHGDGHGCGFTCANDAQQALQRIKEIEND